MLAPGSRRSPTRASLETASLSISSLLVFSSGAKPENPVTLPPGRAKLATKPAPTGSPAFAITMGMVVVALLAADAGCAPRPQLDQHEGEPSLQQVQEAVNFPSANRYSMVIFFPSIHPSLRISCRNVPRVPPYRKQCLHPETLCVQLSLVAARRQKSTAPRLQRKA